MPSTLGHGEVRYLHIPATDIDASAAFYASVFGWAVRTRDAGHAAFDDPTGHLSGTWVLGQEPSREPGLLIHIRVDDVAATLERIIRSGGEAASPMTRQRAGEAVATFRDPAGNVLGIFHERGH